MRVQLVGGPRDGEFIDVDPGCDEVLIPEVLADPMLVDSGDYPLAMPIMRLRCERSRRGRLVEGVVTEFPPRFVFGGYA